MEDNFCVGKISGSIKIDQGILIGGAGAFNWYHFIVEILPKAFLARNLPSEFDTFPFLVAEECKRIPSFSLALSYYSADRSVHFIRNDDIASIGQLVIFDEISVGPFNLVSNQWPNVQDYFQHDSILLAFASDFRRKVLGTDLDRSLKLQVSRRIFLTRPGVRRNFNQDELLEIALRHGFESFSPDDFSLIEQARIFSESSIVVGPSGAAWVGMIFQESPLRGLTWLPKEYEQFCSYSSLANLLGHKLDYIEARTTHTLESTGDAYTANYHVCATQFEIALLRIIGVNE